MAVQVASLFGVLRMDDSQFRTSARDARSEMLVLGDRLDRVGQNVTSLGASLTGITTPIAAVFGLAVRESVKFDESITNIGAVLGLTRGEIGSLRGELLQIGGTRRAGPQAVAEAFYDIVGGVADASTHMAILNAALDTAEAGGANLTATTSGLISVMNSYGFAADQAAFVSDVFTRTVGVGVGTMDEFVSAIGPIAGIAAQTGVSFTELGTSAAFLTTKGFSAAQSATRIQAAITALIKPNEAMKGALKAAGLESGSWALKNLGLAETMRRLNTAMGGSTDEMAAALGTTEALGATLALLGDDFVGFSQDFAGGLEGATAAAQEIQNMSDQAQLDLLNSQMSELAITAGGALVPALLDLVGQARPVIDSVLEWVRANPELVAQIGMLVAGAVVAGPVLLGVGMAISAIGAIIGLVLSPIGLVVAAVVGLALAWSTNWNGIRDTLQPVVDAVVGGVGDIVETVRTWLDQNPEFVVALGLVAVAVVGMTLAVTGATAAFGLLTAAVGLLFSPVVLAAGAIAALLFAVQELYPGGIAGVLGAAATAAQQLAFIFLYYLNTAAQTATMILTWLLSVLQSVIDKIDEFVGRVQAGTTGISGISNLLSTGQIGLGDVWAGIRAEFGFASGIANVPRPLVAELHTGEAVLSAPDAAEWRRNGGMSGGGMTFGPGSVVINANSYSEGRAAADGFEERMRELYEGRGN